MSSRYHDKEYAAICSEKTVQSDEKGFFRDFLDRVVKAAGQDWIQNVFGKLTSDKERIRILYDYEPVCTEICFTLSHVQEIYRKKSPEVSQARRLEAEKAFRNGEKAKALRLYSQSVLRAPPVGENKGGTNIPLALALWGRSEVLIALNEYELAFIDIQTAMKEGLFSSYRAEAFWRMGICYKAKGERDRAKVSFGIAENLLSDDTKKLEKLRLDMARDYEEANHIKKVLPTASKKLSVKESSEFGRFVVATEQIKTGDTIVVEPPYVSCLSPEYFGTHCHHCLERFVAPVGCKTCSSVAFCKAECRDKAMSTYHKYECMYLDLLIGSGMSMLSYAALRMMTQMSAMKCLAIYKDRTLDKVYTFCTNSAQRSPEDFLQRTLMAAFLMRCLQRSNYFMNRRVRDRKLPTEEEFCVGELLLYNLQMLQFNVHEIFEIRHGPNHRFKGAKAVYIGVGIYPTVSLFNHDCYPAVTRYFVGKNIVINAVRPIGAGEFIAENYGLLFTRQNILERQQTLSARYWFTCQCTACKQNWPTLDDFGKVSKRVRCPNEKCKSFFRLPVQNETLKCPGCNKKICLSENIAQLATCEEKLKKAVEMMEKQEPKKGIELLTDAIEAFHRISLPPHRGVHLGQELLRSFLADSGNVSQVSTQART